MEDAYQEMSKTEGPGKTGTPGRQGRGGKKDNLLERGD